MKTLGSVKPLSGYRLQLVYRDGTSGEVDLSSLAGRGVFALWDDPAEFASVEIGEAEQVSWSDEVELCPDALYLELTGKTFEEVFASL